MIRTIKFTKVKNIKIEPIVFYSLLVYSIALIWKYDFFLTQDGPSHLYNSSLLNFYNNSDFLKQFLEKNTLLLPNYTDHIILQYFLKVFNVLLAHKLLLSIIVVFLPITFRYAVKLVSNNSGNYSYIIFALLFNSLLHMGFYNFNLAFIFFNVQIILFLSIINTAKKYYFILLSFLFVANSVILFYTHAFIFGTSLIVLFLLIVFKYYNNFKLLLSRGLFFLLLCLPALTLFFLFSSAIHIPNYDYDLSNFKKFERLMYFAPAINYTSDAEAPYSSLITILVIILITYIIIKKSELTQLKLMFGLSDIFFILSAIIVPLLFYTKNGMLSGMLSDRLVLLFFYLLFFWIASNSINNKVIRLLSIFLILISYINLAEISHKPLREGSIDVVEALKTAEYIKNKSIVYSVNLLEGNDIYGHFTSFLGLNKEVLINQNYEAELGWFPFKWRTNIKPIKCELHNKNIQVPDYVFVFGNFSLLDKKENELIKKFIDSTCINTYNSTDGLTKLYQVNKNKTL